MVSTYDTGGSRRRVQKIMDTQKWGKDVVVLSCFDLCFRYFFVSLSKQKSYTSMGWHLWPSLPSTAATWLETYLCTPSENERTSPKRYQFHNEISYHLPTNDFFGIFVRFQGSMFSELLDKKTILNHHSQLFHPSGWTMHPSQLNQKGIFNNHGAVKDNPFRMVKDRWILLQRSRIFLNNGVNLYISDRVWPPPICSSLSRNNQVGEKGLPFRCSPGNTG